MSRRVVVISDGSGLADHPTNSATNPVRPALARHAALIEVLAGLPTRAIALASGQDLANVLDGLSGQVGAVFLPHIEHHRAARAQADITSVPVVTAQDTTAIALTAALLTALSRAGETPQTGRVVLAGEQTLPILCPLLIATGVGDITTWNTTDATAFPLRRIAADAHAVIALPGDPARRATVLGSFALPAIGNPVGHTADDRSAVIVADEAHHSTIALAGLLRAIVDRPHARPCHLPDLEIYVACVQALVLATPPDRSWPAHADRALTEWVADAVIRAHRPAAERLTPMHPRGDGL